MAIMRGVSGGVLTPTLPWRPPSNLLDFRFNPWLGSTPNNPRRLAEESGTGSVSCKGRGGELSGVGREDPGCCCSMDEFELAIYLGVRTTSVAEAVEPR
jgi:hypothetical protein